MIRRRFWVRLKSNLRSFVITITHHHHHDYHPGHTTHIAMGTICINIISAFIVWLIEICVILGMHYIDYGHEPCTTYGSIYIHFIYYIHTILLAKMQKYKNHATNLSHASSTVTHRTANQSQSLSEGATTT